ncbi:hypothetical protein GALMADRAFT_723684 [Galerina marginata CBS 339.88]|uniref:Nephrocystin 3-like N-terminal domain-containing protein n=1 Tax=Galerina marginata (strain CBS 339.88) TaxID=685588 RepID=A0A067T2C5_GALM3|nr:hypothetical protein GALMADRAFT_723684 [Galerina marginata CBS 339.88]
MFSAANVSSINGGMFNSVEGDLHVHGHEGRGIELLVEQTAPGAFHDSLERRPAPQCHPDTRRVVLKEIMDWAREHEQLHRFLWLSGQAGSGKSSIAQTIAERCQEEGILAAGFFFSRVAEGRNNDSRFIATLAYQLSLSIPDTAPFIGSALNRDAFLFSRSIQAQMDSLIIEPLRNRTVRQNNGNERQPRLGPGLIIIDGLDECSQSRGQNDILNVFSLAVQRFSFPLYFLITSRPEYNIRDAFDEDNLNSLTRRIVLDDKYDPGADIRTFLQSRFKEVKRRHPLKSFLSASWPMEPFLDYLIRKSSGLFIYASTAMKYIQSHEHWPTERLDVILGLAPCPGRDTPFADLDALYMHIFSSVENLKPALQTFGFLLFTQSRLINTAGLVEDFLFFKRGELQLVLSNLHSVIDLPPSERFYHRELRIFHALGDFLTDASRSGRFFISPGMAHNHLAKYCIKHMSPTPTFSLLSHHLVAYIGLMQHCLKADPTDDLLRGLYRFDFEAFLDLPLLGDFPRTLVQIDDFLSMTPLFLQWLQGQNYPYNDNELYHRYLGHFDKHIKTRLSYYPQDPLSLQFFTASTLTEFPRYIALVWRILTLNTPQPDALVFALWTTDWSQAGLRLTSEERTMESWTAYYTMLSEFFTDPRRAGDYYVGRSNYMSLAMKTIDFLAVIKLSYPADSDGANWERQEAAQSSLDLLLACLWHVPKEPSLVTYIRENLADVVITDIEETEERNNALMAIHGYIKDCEAEDLSDEDMNLNG